MSSTIQPADQADRTRYQYSRLVPLAPVGITVRHPSEPPFATVSVRWIDHVH